MMSCLNNGVSGTQRTVTGNLVSLVTNIISPISTLVVMTSLEWPLTLVRVITLPLFISRRIWGEKHDRINS